jgi:hypothetical protein
MVRFKPRRSHSTIRAVAAGGDYVFKNTSRKKFRWIGQLKPQFAQKVAVELAEEFARVAVDEAEVLRLGRRS